MQGIHEKLLVARRCDVVLPGHGPTTTIGDERRTNPLLKSQEFWS